MKKSLSASEALYGFVGWVTMRKNKGALDNIEMASFLVDAFIKANGIRQPSEKKWYRKIIFPKFDKKGGPPRGGTESCLEYPIYPTRMN